MKGYPRATHLESSLLTHQASTHSNVSGMTFTCEAGRNSKMTIVIFTVSLALQFIPFLFINRPSVPPSYNPIGAPQPTSWQDWLDVLLWATPMLLTLAMAGYFWYTLVVRQRGTVTIYPDYLEIERHGLFGYHTRIATDEIQSLRLALGNYPRMIPFVIRTQTQKVRLQLHRVRYEDALIPLLPWTPICEHPLLIAVTAVTDAPLERRDHTWSTPERLEC